LEHFSKGNFAEAASGLQEMLTQGASGNGMESLHFTLAAAWFNAREHAKALAAFSDYVKRYPEGARITDALLGLAQCQTKMGHKQAALASFQELSRKTTVGKERAVWMQAALLKDLGKEEDALKLLRASLPAVPQTEDQIQQACLLATLEASTGKVETALQLLHTVFQRLPNTDNPLQINGLALEVGDLLAKRKSLKEALRAYALVRQKDEIFTLQRSRLQILSRRHAGNLDAMRATPSRIPELQAANEALAASFEEGKKLLEQLEKGESLLRPLRMRQARVYQELGRFWESIVVLENLLQSPHPPDAREEILYGLCLNHAELKNADEQETLSLRYLKEFPSGKNREAVQWHLGNSRFQRADWAGAESVFAQIAARQSSGATTPITLILWAHSRFALGQFASAQEVYADYLKRYPKGEYAQEAGYRIALCHFFLGDYEKAHPALETFVKAHPHSVFAPDAFYRIAVCYQAANRPAEVVQRCAQWEKQFQGDALSAEVFSLWGDALAVMEKREEAAAAYERALTSAPSPEVLQYALFEANKQYQKLGLWAKSSRLLGDFLQNHPQHPSEVTAVYWLAKAMAKEGKTADAKQFLSEKIAASLRDRSRDAVEQLLSQLAQWCAKRPSPAAPPQSGNDASPYDPQEEFSRFLPKDSDANSPLAMGRIFFGRSELARYMRKPKEAIQWLDRIADEIPATALGAGLLAQVGDRLLERGESAKALSFYQELIRSFPKTELLDFAYNGIGQLALAEGQYAKALEAFDDAVGKAGATTKLKEVTLGKGKALLELGRTEEAKALFEQVGSTREWRGEATAESVFFLGEISFRKGDYPLAVQYFQRVFVAYQRYASLVARAYLRTADCFEKMGEPEKSLAHLRELVSREKLSALREADLARKRIEALQAQ
jgi:TolA-binding protein